MQTVVIITCITLYSVIPDSESPVVSVDTPNWFEAITNNLVTKNGQHINITNDLIRKTCTKHKW